MNKKTIIIAILIFGSLFLLNSLGKNRQTSAQFQTQALPSVNQHTETENTSLAPADKIEVVNFFGTKRCVSCLTVGKFTKQTLEEKFTPELESGKIVFKEINGELPENKEMVIKYQARGSSLFINAIRQGQDHINEDVVVWRLVNNQDQFSKYFEDRLNNLLGK